jgi:molybdenum cofactor cytidylyltransferase
MQVFGVVILAAGSSRRMGRPKLLLPWGNTTIIGSQIDTWRSLGVPQIAVVHRAGDLDFLRELDRIRVSQEHRISNPTPQDQMFGSVRCAATWSGWNSNLTHVVISLGDQPQLKPGTLRDLLELSTESPQEICQPLYGGRTRHPIVFPRGTFQTLKNSEATTLKEFLRTENVVGIELNDPGLALDIDDSADYEKALKFIA